MKRLFFAIPLPGDVRRKIISSLPQKNFSGIRWVNEENLHLTTHFLGDTPEEKLGEVIQNAKSICASSSSFELKSESHKTILKERKPVMIWLQFEANKPFDELCFKFRKSFPTEENRTPIAHLTLARIKQLRQLPFELLKAKSFSFAAQQVQLFESHLASAGSEYQLLESWDLI